MYKHQNLGLITITLIIMLTFNPFSAIAQNTSANSSEPTIQVYIDGTKLSMDVPPVLEQGRTLVPLRAIFEALGATVDWNAAEQSISAVKGDFTLKLTIGSTVAIKNGVQVALDVPPRVINARTLVPLRFVSESLNARVEWIAETSTIQIYSSTAQKSPPADAVEFFQKGLKLKEQGQYGQAVIAFSKAIEIHPPYTDAYLHRGMTYSNLHEYDKAVVDFSKGIELNPRNIYAALVIRGQTFGYLKKNDLAIADFNKAIEIDPKQAPAYWSRGNVYLENGQYNAAIADYSRAIELDPKTDTFYDSRGRAYFNLQKYNQAISDFDKAIEMDPKNADSFVNRGTCYLNLKQYNKAITDYTKSIELHPKSVRAYWLRGFTYTEISQYDKAILDANKAIEIDSQFIDAYYLRGHAYLMIGNLTKAAADYKKILEIDPKQEHARLILRDLGVPGY